MNISLIAEGFMEEVVAARLLSFCGHELGNVFGRTGCAYIREKAVLFRHLATEQTGVLVLTDFRDAGVECIPEALNKYIYDRAPHPPKTFLCRFAVNELESWLLADTEGIAKFLGIPVSRIPLHPESEMQPKRKLVELARSSRGKRIREGIAPPPGHYANVGPEYMSLLREFIIKDWSIENAQRNAQSLEHCIRRLREIGK